MGKHARNDDEAELTRLREEVRALRLEADRVRRADRQKIRQLSRAVDQSPNVVLITDTGGRIEYVNPKFTEITGYALDEVIGKDPKILKSGRTPKEEYRRLWKTILAGREWRGEFVNRRKNGELYHGMSAISPIRNEDGEITHFIELMEDVSERRRLEAAIVSVSEQERLLIGQELHDVIGQELTGVTLLAKALQRKLGHEGSAGGQDAAAIAELAGKVLRGVKDLARGLYPSELQRSGLGPALEELVRNQARLFGIACVYREEGAPPSLDPLAAQNLFRIAQEATNNAIKHAQAKQIVVRLSISDRRLTLDVEDDGRGIPVEARNGEGLGLRIMQYRAGMIGAAFDIRDRPGGGTIVSSVMNMEDGDHHG